MVRCFDRGIKYCKQGEEVNINERLPEVPTTQPLSVEEEETSKCMVYVELVD